MSRHEHSHTLPEPSPPSPDRGRAGPRRAGRGVGGCRPSGELAIPQGQRHEGTERPFTSPLLNEHRKGAFACLGCDLPLFESAWKYDSGTGWPSFWTALPGALGKKADFQLISERTEYHCARCLGHQGHVFDDGPRPTGLRYCNNGVALKFVPA
jgi:peptide-methionine (R)-S-oxide reductase